MRFLADDKNRESWAMMRIAKQPPETHAFFVQFFRMFLQISCSAPLFSRAEKVCATRPRPTRLADSGRKPPTIPVTFPPQLARSCRRWGGIVRIAAMFRKIPWLWPSPVIIWPGRFCPIMGLLPDPYGSLPRRSDMTETKDKPEQKSKPIAERDLRHRDREHPRSQPKSEQPFTFTDWASI